MGLALGSFGLSGGSRCRCVGDVAGCLGMCALEVWWVVRGLRWCALGRFGSGLELLLTLSVSLEVAGSVRSAGTALCP